MNEEYTITKADIERLSEIFVTRREYSKTNDETQSGMAALRQDTAVIKARLGMLIGILSAIGVAVLGLAVTLLFA